MKSNRLEPDIKGRLKKLRAALKKEGAQGLLVTDIRNIRYLTGFTGSSGYAVVSSGKGVFLTDSRYATQAAEELAGTGFKIIIYQKPVDALKEAAASLGVTTLGFEANHLTYETLQKIRKAFRGVKLKPLSRTVNRIRAVKDAFEVEAIKKAARLLDEGFSLAEKILRPGMSEKKAAFDIETFWKGRGAEGAAFDTIIASGFRGALPHGKASDKKIRKGDFVVVDMGVLLNGYNSDETRTYCLDRPSKKLREIYEIVKAAQEAAISKIRPGATCKEVDAAARDHIEKAGYGKYFGHGTGHGVGLDIHEAPNLSPLGTETLEEGMVVTVEPGIYLPDEGGVRIEDMALVTAKGCELLTKTPREFLCV